jgi:hypothetical protein
MAESFDIHVVTLNVGNFIGATELPLAQLATGGGGATVIGAAFVGPSAGTTVGGKLVTMTNVGTPAINGTIGSFAGTVVTAAGVPGALTVSDGFVEAGEWIGFDQTSGTVPAGTFISLSYVMGKG